MNPRPSDICVCLTACGDSRYLDVAEQAVRSVLRYSNFTLVRSQIMALG